MRMAPTLAAMFLLAIVTSMCGQASPPPSLAHCRLRSDQPVATGALGAE